MDKKQALKKKIAVSKETGTKDKVKVKKPKKVAKEIQRNKHELNLEGRVFGRVASEIALLLSGKRKVNYVWHLDQGDFVVAYNLSKIKFTGPNKYATKKYYRYTGYPGGIKEMTLGEAIEKDFEKVFRNAVHRMLPKNRLRKEMIKRLEIKEGELGKN